MGSTPKFTPEQEELIKVLERNWRPRGIPITGKEILAGELCPGAELSELTSKEAFNLWLEHYNMPLPQASQSYKERYANFKKNVEAAVRAAPDAEARKRVALHEHMDWNHKGVTNYGVII